MTINYYNHNYNELIIYFISLMQSFLLFIVMCFILSLVHWFLIVMYCIKMTRMFWRLDNGYMRCWWPQCVSYHEFWENMSLKAVCGCFRVKMMRLAGETWNICPLRLLRFFGWLIQTNRLSKFWESKCRNFDLLLICIRQS
jgi:hypothetical protein